MVVLHKAGIVVAVVALCAVGAAQMVSPWELEASRAQADAVLEHVPVAEVLGPMAPLALSPFFGLLCLSGMAQMQDRGWLPENMLMEQHPLLGDMRFFVVLVVLTLLTSLPKLATVSKFFAQAVDQVEAYSGLLMFLLIFVWARVEPPEQEVVQAGVLEVTQTTLLALACAVNFIVINTVKYFFELLALITPVPLLDAGFEVANKGVCLGFAVAYAYNPYLALVPGAVLFLVCLPLFLWARHGMIYYKTLLLDPFLKSAWSRWRGRHVPDVPSHVTRHLAHACGEPVQLAVKVFPDRAALGLPRKRLAYLLLTRRGVYVVRLPWLRVPVVAPLRGHQMQLRRGRLLNCLMVTEAGGETVKLTFSRYYAPELEAIAAATGATLPVAAEVAPAVWSKAALRQALE